MQHRKAERGHGSVKKEREMGEEMREVRERKIKNMERKIKKSKSRGERVVTYSEDRRKK